MDSFLRRMTMERSFKLLTSLLAVAVVASWAFATGGVTSSCGPEGNVSNVSNVSTQQTLSQSMQGQGYAVAEGGEAVAEGGEAVSYSGGSSSGANAIISTNAVSNYKYRTQPLSVTTPYLPFWSHGGWGTLKAYFPNGPNTDDAVYERTFDPANPDDMTELRDVIQSLPYDGPLDVLGGIINGVVAVFGGPDHYHHGRGFEIASSLVRCLRPRGKPLFVFIDTNIDKDLLKEAGYAYVGKVSVEGEVDRNWDHVYDAAVAEALPWDVDILLVSGGMKGVSVGSNLAFPGAGVGYSQTNYSISLFGAYAEGITEGKGKAMVSASGYRYWPEVAYRRRIPRSIYDRIRVTKVSEQDAKGVIQGSATTGKRGGQPGVQFSRELYELAGFEQGQQVQNVRIR
jgi:hypothetical protein